MSALAVVIGILLYGFMVAFSLASFQRLGRYFHEDSLPICAAAWPLAWVYVAGRAASRVDR